jgi:hypothetical protein
MGELDFAFFNLIKQDKKGLFYKKGLLDRLTPFIFHPRIKNLIQLPSLDPLVCLARIPGKKCR